jgi:hypothetical protein
LEAIPRDGTTQSIIAAAASPLPRRITASASGSSLGSTIPKMAPAAPIASAESGLPDVDLLNCILVSRTTGQKTAVSPPSEVCR